LSLPLNVFFKEGNNKRKVFPNSGSHPTGDSPEGIASLPLPFVSEIFNAAQSIKTA